LDIHATYSVADPEDFEGGCGEWYENRVPM
jgi:hypothetical protein